jgi:hypothetical protein
VRSGCLLQGQRLGDRNRQGAVPGRRRELGRRLLLGCGRKVVASEQPDRDVVEQQGPEREVGPVTASGVGRDDGVDLGDGGVEVDVVGERHLDDAVDSVRSLHSDGTRGVGLV